MAPASRSLTSTSSLSRSTPTTADNSLSPTHSHFSMQHAFSTDKLSTLASPSFVPSITNLPAGRLIDYSSSKDEVVEKQARPPENRNTATHKKQKASRYKSAEFVHSESDGSDGDTSDHHQRSRRRSPNSLEQTSYKAVKTASKKTVRPESSGALATSGKMVNRSRSGGMNSLTWGASVSQPARETKKRPLPPAAPYTTVKRPKIGPFIDESGSERDGDSNDDDDGSNFHGRISVTPRLPERSRRNEVQTPDGEGDGIMAPRASFQQKVPDRASERQLSTPKTTPTSLPKRALNKDRLKMLMEKKQGNVVAQSSMQQRASLPLGRVEADLRNRPMNGAQAGNSPQKQPAGAIEDDGGSAIINACRSITFPMQNGTTRQDVHSPTSKGAPLSLQGTRPQQVTQSRTPNLSPKLAGQPSNEANRSSQATRTPMQKSDPHPVASLQALVQQIPASRPISASPLRTAKTARPHNAAKSSSLRNILDTAKAEHRSIAKEQDNIGSQWRKAQAERASARSVKQVPRPELGARYGHTLMARKANKMAKEPMGMRNALVATSARKPQTPLSAGPRESSLLSPKAQAQASARRPDSASTASPPVDQPSAIDLPHSALEGRQNRTDSPINQSSRPAPSTCGVPPASTLAIEQSNGPVLPRNDENQKQRTPGSPSGSKTPSLNARFAIQALTVSKESPASHDARPQNSVGAPSKTVVSPRDVQTNCASPATNTSSTGSTAANLAQEGIPQSVQETMITRSNSPTDAASIEGPVHGEAPEATAPKFARTYGSPAEPLVFAHGAALGATEATDSRHESYTAYASDASGLSPTSFEWRTRTEIPVAVMVRPGQGLDVRFLPTGGAGDASLAVTQATCPDHTANLSDASECIQSLTGKLNAQSNALPATTVPLAPTGGIDDAASDVPESIDINVDQPSSRVPEEVTQLLSPALLAAVAPERHSGEPIEPTKTAPPNPINSVQGRSTSSAPSSPIVPQSASTPPGPPTPLSTEESTRLKATATILSPRADTETSSPQFLPASNTSTHPETTSTVLPVSEAAAQSPNLTFPAEIALPPPTISPTAEPYFEYTIHQALSSSASSNITTETFVQPLTSLDAANAQIDKLFQNAKQQYGILGMQCKSTTNSVDEHALSAYEGAFEGIEDPSKILSLKLWVERNEVGMHANRTPATLHTTPSINRTVYALRLWKLIDTPSSSESDSDTSDAESEGEHDDTNTQNNGKVPLRVFHPLPHICTEIHTSLSAANRAAKRVQIALSHEKNPKQPLQKQWQTQSLQELNYKLEELRREMGGDEGDDGGDASPDLFEYEQGRRKGCWRSVFNGSGLGADRYELLVSRVGVSGPRNL